MKTNFYSPLRYPGGKLKLSFYIQLLFEYNLLTDGQYVEPYGGGCSVALSLLINEYASVIHINDYDYSIYCFWYSVLNNTEELCDKINLTEVNIENWRIQRQIQLKMNNHSEIDIGFSTFFLNRTNRSGILNAGIIGGKNQIGKWKIDARFNKEELIGRIKRVSRYRDRIKLYNLDAIDFINQIKNKIPNKSLFYFDPPYYNKGKEIYLNFYNHADHVKISNLIRSLRNRYWIISYDNSNRIDELYKKFRKQTFNLNYHTGKASKGTEVLIFSNNLLIPEIINPINKKEIEYYSQTGLYARWHTNS